MSDTTSTKMTKADHIPMRRAYVKFARKTLGIKPYHDNYWGDTSTASVHTLPSGCKIVRIGEDEIAVTDGGPGYTPFSISELQAMLREARKLPIVKKFRTDAW